MHSNNASFKYPDLPKKVENININAVLKNDDGISDNTYLDIKTLDFKIDQDIFKSSTTIKNLTKNMLVNTAIDGVLNLGNISKAYPIDLDKDMSGILKGKLQLDFDMNALESNAFERIKSNGNLDVMNFVFSSQDIVNLTIFGQEGTEVSADIYDLDGKLLKSSVARMMLTQSEQTVKIQTGLNPGVYNLSLNVRIMCYNRTPLNMLL